MADVRKARALGYPAGEPDQDGRVLLLLFTACAPTTPGATTWTAAAVEAALPALLEAGLPDPWVLAEVYLGALAQGDSACPGPGDDLAPPAVTLEGCEAGSGWRYAGVSTYEDWGGADAPDFWMLNADFVLTDPEGLRFEAGGSFGMRGGGQGEARWWQAEVQGSFRYPAAPGWLGQGGGVILSVAGERGAAGLQAELEGAIHGAEHQLFLDTLRFGDCPGGEASGQVRLRAPGGAWAELELGCGCGPATEGGQPLGEVCPALGALGAALEEQVTW